MTLLQCSQETNNEKGKVKRKSGDDMRITVLAQAKHAENNKTHLYEGMYPQINYLNIEIRPVQ